MLNRTKTKEVVFVDTRRKRQVAAPPALPGIVRVTSLNTRRYYDEWPVGVWPCPWHHQRLRADSLRIASLAACVTRRCRPSTNRSSSPSYCMYPVLGRDLLRQPTDSESTHSSAAAPAAASVRQTFRRSKNCLKHLTSSSSVKSSTTSTICCTITFHLRQQPHRTTTCDPGYTIDNYLTILVISQTVISSPASCTTTFTS